MSLILDDSTSDRISHGTALGNFTAASWLQWIYPTTLTNFNNFWYLESTTNFQSPSASVRGGDEIGLAWRGSGGTNLLYVTNNANLTVNKWWYIAWTVDQLGTPGTVGKIYLGDLSTIATERTYGTTTDGALLESNTDGTFTTGSEVDGTTAVGGRYGGLMMWPGVVLTLAQIQQHQFRFVPQVAGCKLFTRYGYAGTGTQPDWTGTGNNGTQTGAVVGDDVPLGPAFGYPAGWPGAFTAAVVAGQPIVKRWGGTRQRLGGPSFGAGGTW